MLEAPKVPNFKANPDIRRKEPDGATAEVHGNRVSGSSQKLGKHGGGYLIDGRMHPAEPADEIWTK